MDLLLGSSGSDTTLFGLDGSELSLFEDGADLLTALVQTQSELFTVKKKSESVTGFGKTQLVYTLTLTDAEADQLGTVLQEACPEGKLKELLASISFSGKQSLTLLVTNEGSVHKITYSGRCGKDADHMRKVSLTWKLARDDQQALDSLTLKAPAVSGSDTCELTWKQTLKQGKDGLSEELSFSWTDKQGENKQSLTGEAKLIRKDASDGSAALSGSITLTNKENSNSKQKLTLKPELTFTSDTLDGSVHFQLQEGGSTTLEGTIQAAVSPCEDFSQTLWASSVALGTLNEEELAALRQELLDQAATALVAHWVLLPTEDTLYLSQDLSDEVWQQIGFAAMSLTEEEE